MAIKRILKINSSWTELFTRKKKKTFENIVGKKKMVITGISYFSTNDSTQWQTTVVFWVTFNVSSANAFSFDRRKVLSFVKESTDRQTYGPHYDLTSYYNSRVWAWKDGVLKTLWE